MVNYQRLLSDVMSRGTLRPDRTGTGTMSLFGQQLKFLNTEYVFPAVTIKRLPFRGVAGELASFLKGTNNLADFQANGCRFWDKNAEHTSGSSFVPRWPGHLGRIYGEQWRAWKSLDDQGSMVVTDQLRTLVNGLKANPCGRRHLVLAYNPGELDEVCLPACHVLFQCYSDGHTLDLLFWMRSVDLFLGLPCDIALYALLHRLLARECNLKPSMLVAQLGDAHIYMNHMDQVREALARKPKALPRLLLEEDARLFAFHPESVKLEGYDPHPSISAPLAQ